MLHVRYLLLITDSSQAVILYIDLLQPLVYYGRFIKTRGDYNPAAGLDKSLVSTGL